jgi:FAD/FMN-containing dehydrogenase/Fe-S oxidoreductase
MGGELKGLRKSPKPPVDAEALAARLRRKIRGEVRFDPGSRALYATDGSNYRQVPIGVVIPRDAEDVIETVALCRQFGAPILGRGGGTSLAGQCCNAAVIMDFSKYMNRLVELNPKEKFAIVQPGIICDGVRDEAEKYHLTFGPDPATHAWCTIGGMLGNNSCGVHSQMAGRTADNVEELEILTYDGLRTRVGRTSDADLAKIIGDGGRRGEIYVALKKLRDKYARLIRKRYPDIPRRISGYNLDELLPEAGFHVARALVGSESTCVIVLEAKLKLVHSPPSRSLLVLGYPDVFTAGDHVPEVSASGAIGLEALDKKFIIDLRLKHLQEDNMKLLPSGGGFLLVEYGGDTKMESDAKAMKFMAKLRLRPNAPTMKLFDNREEEERIWKVRESGLGATAHIPGEEENWEGWEDSAVPPEHVGAYLRDLKKLYDKYGYVGSLYGHFGQGCIHTRINFDLKTAAGVQKFRSFIDEATTLVLKHGGSLSGEHGDGQSRAEFLYKMFGPELIEAFHEFKTIWDPQWKMNPGKVVRPFRIDENLRYGPEYRTQEPTKDFHYVDDGWSFARAMERCVGVGECRRHNSGTMCPSYMVTHEEMHSTRGRARLLFEMMQGDVLRDGWRSKAVKESLDLCLSCKGCKGDCPVNVDMATYKAEFLSKYYKHRVRPRHAYAFGLIHNWARLGGLMPGMANFFSQSQWTSGLMKWFVGMAPERQVPAFAHENFKHWFKRRPETHPARPAVVLWPDTFNNYFHPEVAKAAVEVLEDAGFRIIVPQTNMCCGRPLYDYGMLATAKRWLRDILDTMRTEIQAGLPFVVLEPSCCAVFRDELCNMLPHDQDAARLRNQTFLLDEFLQKKTPKDYRMPQLRQKALVHMHCHHRAAMGIDCHKQVLSRMGLDFEVLDSGCCGMAGAFGFEKGEHYEVSIKCGERVLLPRVREAPENQLIITSGFSCREQMHQCAGKRAHHLAEVLQMALQTGRREAVQQKPEEIERIRRTHRLRNWTALGIGALVAATAAGALLMGRDGD